MFVDQKIIAVEAGKGGDGATLFRREKYVPYGGPDGGDGGKGGDVIIVGRSNLHALNHLARTDKIAAEKGQDGAHQRSSGKNGQDIELPVPLGTLIEEGIKEGFSAVTEITKEGQQFVIAKGGNGGWGNWHFKSSIQQAPQRHNDGLPGQKKQLRITLKLIADIGLIGLPNAGKSTLLASVSAAQPKIANYPFTTLEPQLGVANIKRGKEETQVVIADLPGLIEGASKGKGLGIQFLRHVERTRTVVHCIDSTTPLRDLIPTYKLIRDELSSWSERLADKKEVIALTKCELVSKIELLAKQRALHKHTGETVYVISAATHQGLTELLTNL